MGPIWKRRLQYGLVALGLTAALLYGNNASWLAPKPSGEYGFIAHRGVHQTYDRTDLGRDDCTATRIDPPSHGYLENTLPSIAAAFRHGAEIVEIDIHSTADGEFVVFHDWTVDCRTEGTGVTRTLPLATLKSLDIGYGYTADGGRTFPFRGKGVGLMPTLGEVLGAFPDKGFLINIKSDYTWEAEALAAYLTDLPTSNIPRLAVYGGRGKATTRLKALIPEIPVFSQKRTVACLTRYVLLGWSGYVPEACRDTYVLVPIDYAWLAWGFPRRLEARLADAGSRTVIAGPVHGPNGLAGIDTLELLGQVPPAFGGLIWTDKIEIVGRELDNS